jgi:hypothetical protein
MIIARPIAASAADKIKINKVKIYPKISSIIKEIIIKFKLIAKNINSIAIKVNIIFLLIKIIPNNPIKNKKIVVINIKFEL